MDKKAATLFGEAVTCFKSGETDNAFDLFNEVISLDSGYQEEGRDNPYFYLGCLYADRGDLTKALECYTRSLELWPDDESSFEGRAICLREMGEYAKAISDFESIFRIDPNFRQMPARDIYREIWDTAVLKGSQGKLLLGAAEALLQNPDDAACEKMAVYINCRLDACYSEDRSSGDNRTEKIVRNIVQSIHEIRLLKFNLDDAFETLKLSDEDLKILKDSYYGIEGIAFDLERKITSLASLDDSVREELAGRWLFSNDDQEMEI